MPIGFWVAGTVLAMAISAAASGSPLEEYRWKNRIVLIFGSDTDVVSDQVKDFKAQAAEVDDRDLVLITVDDDAAQIVHGRLASKLDPSALRNAFSVDATTPFTLILVGKDGGEKLRKAEPVSPANIFGLIDSMPMRAQETSKK